MFSDLTETQGAACEYPMLLLTLGIFPPRELGIQYQGPSKGTYNTANDHTSNILHEIVINLADMVFENIIISLALDINKNIVFL